jgi:hypothetical protein
MAQTSYSNNHGVAFKGMKADSRFDFVATGVAEGIIGFGFGLKRGTDPEYQVLVIDNVADVFHGIALYEESQTTGNYPDTKPTGNVATGGAFGKTIAAAGLTTIEINLA